MDSGGAGEHSGGRTPKSGRSQDLEEELTIVQFSKIMDKFEEIGQQDSPYQRSPEVSTDDFCVILAEVFGKHPVDRKVKSLCSKIDAEGLGFIKAEEFCSYIIQKLKEKDSLSQNLSLPFNDPPKLRHTILCKETICRLNPCFNPTRYISVSKNGLLGVWSSQITYQHGKNLLDSWPGGRVKVTDCLMMGNCNKLVLSLSSRELAFFDTVDSFKCKYKLHDLPSIPLCLDYYYDPKVPKSTSHLLFGDDSGSVSILTFTNPAYGLFSAPTKDDENKVHLVAYSHIPSNGKFVSQLNVPHLHSDWVNGVRYIPHNHTFISSTNSSVNSLIIRDISHGTNNYVFKLRKGVQCFDYSRSADLLVTGSIDHFVRVFNPFVPAKPVATLTGHDTTVAGVAIAAEMKMIFSLGRNLVVCAWDLCEHLLLQTVTIKLPFIQRLPDFGGKPLLLLPSAESLIVISNEYTAELKLGLVMGSEEDKDLFISHKYPLCAALYNKHFNQVVSGCEGGVVNIWDIGSGSLMVRLTDCHGKNEITAMNLDKMGRLLMTGSRAGDIKVWQYIGSTCIKHMQKNDYTEVTGIIHVPEKRAFISVGWDKKITAFKDDPDVYAAVPNESWKRHSTYHNDDILCVAYSSPHYLATGSFDGEIKVWNVDLERVIVQYSSICRIKPHILQKLKNSIGISKRSASFAKMSPLSTASSSRPVSRRLASRQRRLQSMSSSQIQHVPVDQLLFLHKRMRAKVKGAGILVSSEAGMANFWDLFGKINPVGSFLLTDNEDENVLAMTIDPTETHLLAGDTLGTISIFNIQDYCSTGERGDKLEPIARWKAHTCEVVSIDYAPHRTQPLVLSASGDGTIRLWTLMGHFIGTFGQDKPWDLQCTATFQHPKTPWGDMWKSDTNVSSSSFKSSSQHSISSQRTLERKSLQTPVPLKEVPEQSIDILNGGSSRKSSLSSALQAPLQDEEELSGDSRSEITKKGKADGKDRKTMLAISKAMADKVDSHAPFHALQLSKMDEIKIPKDISMALKNSSS